MKLLFISLNKPLISIETNKQVLEFDDISHLENSMILQPDKMQRLIDQINDSFKSDLTDFTFQL